MTVFLYVQLSQIRCLIFISRDHPLIDYRCSLSKAWASVESDAFCRPNIFYILTPFKILVFLRPDMFLQGIMNYSKRFWPKCYLLYPRFYSQRVSRSRLTLCAVPQGMDYAKRIHSCDIYLFCFFICFQINR